MALHVTYWNLTNSHWEPLIDPWSLSFRVRIGNLYSLLSSDNNRVDC